MDFNVSHETHISLASGARTIHMVNANSNKAKQSDPTWWQCKQRMRTIISVPFCTQFKQTKNDNFLTLPFSILSHFSSTKKGPHLIYPSFNFSIISFTPTKNSLNIYYIYPRDYNYTQGWALTNKPTCHMIMLNWSIT